MKKMDPRLSNDFRIDEGLEIFPSQNKIKVEGELKQLEPRLMNVLLFLILNQGKVVSREEILEEVWKDVVVNDEAVTQGIYQLRKLFRGTGNGKKYIETIPKKGYRFFNPEEGVRFENEKPKVDFLFIDTLLRPRIALPSVFLFVFLILAGGWMLNNGNEPEPVVSTKKMRAMLVNDELVFLDSLAQDFQSDDSISIRLSVPASLYSPDGDIEDLEKIMSLFDRDSLEAMIREKESSLF